MAAIVKKLNKKKQNKIEKKLENKNYKKNSSWAKTAVKKN